MKLNKLYNLAKQYISEDVTYEDIFILFKEIYDIDSYKLLINEDIELDENKIIPLLDRLKDEPLGYILSKQRFLKRDFYINKDVLIPRYETEELTLLALNDIKNYKYDDLVILDMCSGSGCIGISLDLELEKLKTIFHRGFTYGHLFQATKEEIMNPETPNHIGQEIGKVIDITPQKIKIKLKKTLNQQDGIRFLKSGKGFIVNYLYDATGKLINQATDVCYVNNKVNLQEKDIITKTFDYQLFNELKNITPKKIPITIEVIAKKGKPFQVKIRDQKHTLELQGKIVQNAKNAPISKERIRIQIEKLGTTPFLSSSTKIIADDNIFIPIKEINEMRHTIVDQLISLRREEKKLVIKKEPLFQESTTKITPGLSATVTNEDQLKLCQKLNFKRIYLSQKELYQKYKSIENIYYKLPRCSRTPLKNSQKKSLVAEYFDFSKIENPIGDYGQNVANIYTIYYLKKYGLKEVTLSVELTEEEIEEIINNYYKKFHSYPEVEIIGYGRIENMIIKGNILNLKANDTNYKLKDQKNRKFPVYFDGTNTHILNYLPRDLEKKELLKKYCDIRLEFTQESPKEIKEIIKKY